MGFLLFLLILGYFIKAYFDKNPENYKAFRNWVKKLTSNFEADINNQNTDEQRIDSAVKVNWDSSKTRYASSSPKTTSSRSSSSAPAEKFSSTQNDGNRDINLRKPVNCSESFSNNISSVDYSQRTTNLTEAEKFFNIGREKAEKASSASPNSRSVQSNNNSSSSAGNLEQKTPFSKERMQQIKFSGYEFYQKAEKERSAELYYKAGEAYDSSYDAFWGDHVFGRTDYQSILNDLGLSDVIDEEGAKELIKAQQESLAISCECYAKCLVLDPDHYEANLRLATALTVALQVDASLLYWRKALAINLSNTLEALVVDSTGFNHRSLSAKVVIKRLNLQRYSNKELAQLIKDFGSSYWKFHGQRETPGTVQEVLSFIQQKAIASSLLQSSAFLIQEIQNLGSSLARAINHLENSSEEKMVVVVVNGNLFDIVAPIASPLDTKSEATIATIKSANKAKSLQDTYGAELQMLPISTAQANELRPLLKRLRPRLLQAEIKLQKATDECDYDSSSEYNQKQLQVAVRQLESVLRQLDIHV